MNRDHIVPYFGKLSPFVPFRSLVRHKKDMVFLPFYHALGEVDELPHIKHLYQPKSVQKFTEDLEFILKHFKAISLQELIQFNHKEIHFNEPVFHLSFDDGLRQVYEYALPILEQKGIPATIFINTNFIDNKDLFFRYKASLLIERLKGQSNKIAEKILKINDYQNDSFDLMAKGAQINFKSFLSDYQPYMTSNQIKDCIKRGFTIGAHSINHPRYDLIHFSEQKKQTLDSVNYLLEHFNINYKSFSFPFSDDGVSINFFNEINDLDITFGTSGIKKDEVKNHLQRTGMERGNLTAKEIITGEYLYYNLAKMVGKHIRKHPIKKSK